MRSNFSKAVSPLPVVTFLEVPFVVALSLLLVGLGAVEEFIRLERVADVVLRRLRLSYLYFLRGSLLSIGVF